MGSQGYAAKSDHTCLQSTQIGLGAGAYSQSLLKLEYSYGTTANNGNVVEQKITVPGVTHPFVQAYTYDELNRLKSATETQNSTQTWKQTFTFDRFGNRNFDEANTTFAGFDKLCSGNTVLCADLKKRLNPTINTSNNRLSTSDDYAFDASGNTTSDPDDRTFIYDAENKQIEVKDSLNATIGQYIYDGDGKRIKKIVPGGETTIFVYDAGGKLIGEYSTVVQTGSNAKTTFTTTDSLGSPRINTDGAGAVISRHDHHPFGEEVVRSGYGSDTIQKQFTGYERDNESSLDFAQARYYNPAHGRFTSVDPLKESATTDDPQSWNRYAYSFNNPLRFTDPSGMIAGDFYDREGNWLGTDEIGDGKIYLLGPNQVPNKENKNINWGGKLDDKTVADLKGASIEVGGLIILDRTEEGKDYTVGEFKTVGGGDKDASGYMLEPADPDTTTPNQDKRVPEGLYNLDNHSGKKHKDTFVISNENVPKSRAILFHRGYSGSWTEGCIMPGSGARNGRITAGTSEPKMAELKAFIKAEGASNVKFIIRNRIRN